MLGTRYRRVWSLVYRCQTHLGHRPPNPLAAKSMPVLPHGPHHLPKEAPRYLQGLSVDHTDRRRVSAISRTGRCLRPVPERRPADRHEVALPYVRQMSALQLDQPTALLDTNRPEAINPGPGLSNLAPPPADRFWRTASPTPLLGSPLRASAPNPRSSSGARRAWLPAARPSVRRPYRNLARELFRTPLPLDRHHGRPSSANQAS